MPSNLESPEAEAGQIGRDAAVLLARAGWLEVADGVLSGLSHELSGRIAALDALVHLGDIQGREGPSTGTYLESEVEKLQRTGELLRTVPGDLGANAEGVLPSDLASRSVAISRVQSLLSRVDIQTSIGDDVAPIVVNQARFFRTLLILLSRAASCADALRLTEIVMTGETVGDEVVLLIEPGSGQDQGRSEDPDDESIKALADLLAMDGGSLCFPERGFVGVRLPTLASVRALEDR